MKEKGWNRRIEKNCIIRNSTVCRLNQDGCVD
jgi:hypothetical protein